MIFMVSPEKAREIAEKIREVATAARAEPSAADAVPVALTYLVHTLPPVPSPSGETGETDS
jgi:hypothetical protein